MSATSAKRVCGQGRPPAQTIRWVMHDHLRQLLREARVSRFEEHSFLTGLLSIGAAVVLAVVNRDLGGAALALGALGLAVLGLCATSRAVRLYRASVAAALPESVGRAGIRSRPRWISTVTTAMLALVLPAAAAVTMVALVEWGWLVITAALLLGCLGLLVSALNRSRDLSYAYPPGPGSAVLERLCMRADIPVPSSSWRRTPRRTPGRREAAFT